MKSMLELSTVLLRLAETQQNLPLSLTDEERGDLRESAATLRAAQKRITHLETSTDYLNNLLDILRTPKIEQ